MPFRLDTFPSIASTQHFRPPDRCDVQTTQELEEAGMNLDCISYVSIILVHRSYSLT